MKNLMLLLLVFVLYQRIHFLCKALEDDSLKIGAFNIQNLGVKKISNDKVMTIIKNIILRYDIILIQEIVTSDQSLIDYFLQSINSFAPEGVQYNMVLSERLGRGTSKEQYAFLYRIEKVSVLVEDVYPDDKDNFMRPPYMVHFLSPTLENLSSFIAIGIHTQPSNAAIETDLLAEVYDYAKNKYKTTNAIILGDMNAACSYVRVRDWNNIRLWTRKEFTWLIGHKTDTTTNDNDCAYDRIVIAGNKMKNSVIRNSAKIFNFQDEYGLTIDETKNVSDHFPVEVILK